MIKFFRKIRYDLIEKNKTGKYLNYAIGEIILVVIGILIALQINNWNEERKSNEQIHALLDNLKTSIEEDKEYLNTTAVLHEFRSNSLSRLYHYALNKKEPNSPVRPISKLENNTIWKGSYPDSVNLDFANLTIIYSGIHDDVVINKNVLDELKNTGLFSELKNDALKESINTYYSFVNSNFLIDDWNKDLSISWRHFLRDKYDVLTMELYNINSPYDLVRKNEPIQTRIHEMIGPARFRSSNATKAIKLAEYLLIEIDKYQNKK
ncbi:DUF6090 family protein [Winogradskyella vincentii]|uniref:Uncharacterized protein n=1 Tax=Winogradskyella vincentii TaxID=2877122 RepID=A0ABS7XZR5_9FLAO|nr:DUF6090 family protein [Winogradskyella vincentii]MCA0153127.1 hypothetical protein [Winogradskyella vincentii]